MSLAGSARAPPAGEAPSALGDGDGDGDEGDADPPGPPRNPIAEEDPCLICYEPVSSHDRFVFGCGARSHCVHEQCIVDLCARALTASFPRDA